MNSRHRFESLIFLVAICLSPALASGQDDSAPEREVQSSELSLADGQLTMQAPGNWNVVEPKFNMIEAEFSVPRQGDDEKDGRLTIMAAGGSVEANIQRWESQFSQAGDDAGDNATTVDEMEFAGMKTHMVDISGTYADRAGGPTSPPVMRDNYRMLAAIIETDDMGTYFIKFYGGAATVDANEAAFEKFIKSLERE